MRLIRLLFALCLLTSFALPAFVDSTSKSPRHHAAAPRMGAQPFMQAVVIDNWFEIQAAKQALYVSQDSGVRSFAMLMLAGHMKANSDLTEAQYWAKARFDPPRAPDEKRQAMINTLRQAGPADFDAQYMKMELDNRRDAVRLFSRYARSGSHKALRKFAADAVTLERHYLDLAKGLQGTS